MPETPEGTDRPAVRPDVPRAPSETLERAVAAVRDRKDFPMVTGWDSVVREFVTSCWFYQAA